MCEGILQLFLLVSFPLCAHWPLSTVIYNNDLFSKFVT